MIIDNTEQVAAVRVSEAPLLVVRRKGVAQYAVAEVRVERIEYQCRLGIGDCTVAGSIEKLPRRPHHRVMARRDEIAPSAQRHTVEAHTRELDVRGCTVSRVHDATFHPRVDSLVEPRLFDLVAGQ